MTAPYCGRCGNDCDSDDNFCRRCGHQLTVTLPVVRRPNLPAARTQPSIPPSLVGSMAVLAVGTGLEWLARRVANNAVRALVTRGPTQRKSKQVQAPASSMTVEEVLYVRKVQLRR